MYPDRKFHVEDLGEVRAFLEQHPFATLVAMDAEGVFAATHLPLLVQDWGERIVLRGHLMRETDHWRALKQARRVFASFVGPDAPVLGSWQLTPAFGGTWNYQAVQLQGVIHGQDQPTLLAHLETLKNRFETSPDHRFDSLPAGYVDALAPMIECIDLVVADLKCIFKLSQNRRVEEFDRTLAQLERKGGKSALVAEEMRRRRGQYYA